MERERLTMKKHLRYSGLIASLLLLAGCGLLQTEYQQPQVNVPGQWTQHAPGVTETGLIKANATTSDIRSMPLNDHWWRNFNDPTLNALVDKALAKNNDLAAATIRVRQAQLQFGLAENDLFPVLSADGSADRTSHLSKPTHTDWSYGASANVSYELDLWGRISSLRDAADWEAQATEEDRESTALTLIGTTVDLYWQIGFLNERIALSEQSIAYAQKTFDLVQVQYGAGGVSSLEVKQAEQNLAAQQAAHTQLIQQRVEAYNALAILFDGPPNVIEADPQRLPKNALPPVEAGIPADLLARRPDIKAAELRLRETLSDADATKLSYLPTISLTGSLGSSSIALTDIMKNPIGALGAGVTLPFLEINKMLLDIKVSKEEFKAAVVTYRQTLYSALSDVENALSARAQFAAQGEKLQQAFDAAKETERLYELRYRAGAVPLKDWLDAQETRRTAEVAVAENYYNRLVNHVTLYQALGGDTKLPAVVASAQ